jgi:DNA polymerase III sliding clamp (beta) subunit (PCNA family)
VDITIAHKDLSRLLTKAAAVVDDKATKVIMKCVILDASNNTLIAKAADENITMSVTTRTACEVAKPGIVAVHAKDLLARVQLLAVGPVRLVNRDNKLEIIGIGTKRKHVLSVLAVSDYPSFPEPSGKVPPIQLVSRSFARMLAHVEYAMCSDATRPNVNGTAVEFDGKWLHVVALDSRGMSRISTEFATEAPLKLLVQQQAAIQLRKVIEASRTDIEASSIDIAVDGANMFFTLASTRLSVKMLSVEFAQWQPVLNGLAYTTSVEVGRAKLIDMIKSADVAAKEGYVRIDFAPTALRVWAESDGGASEDDVPISYIGKAFTLGLTAKAALDVLSALESDMVRLLVGSSNDPGLEPLVIRPVTDKTDELFDGVIMPRRL